MCGVPHQSLYHYCIYVFDLMLMMCYFAEPPVGLYHYKCQLEGCYILIYIIKMEVWKGLVSCGTVVYIIKKPSMHQIKRYNI